MKALGSSICILAMVALLLGLGVMNVGATGPTNTSPDTALGIDNQTHLIEAGTSLWYDFDYAGDRSQIVIRLVNGNAIGLAFNLWTPAQVVDWSNLNPVGRGSPSRSSCSAGCQADDLIWTGNFNSAGTYYVQVVNPRANAQSFQLIVQGSGVVIVPTVVPPGLTSQPSTAGTNVPTPAPSTTSTPLATSQPAATGTSVPAPAPSATITPPVNLPNTDPVHALVIDSQPHTFPPNTTLWYSFEYRGGHSQVYIILENGGAGGLQFNIWTHAQIPYWWDPKPIGRGQTLKIDCDTGRVLANGQCQSSELFWIGKLATEGTYYVQVINTGPNSVDARLTVQGEGVILE